MTKSSLTDKKLISIRDWYKYSVQQLKDIGITSAQIDTLILIEYVLKISRSQLFTQFNQPLNNYQLKKLNKLLNLRLTHFPIAYITKRIEFYYQDFIIDKGVLIPRPETEKLVEIAINLTELFKNIFYLVNSQFNFDFQFEFYDFWKAADIGCGSGNIGISLSKKFPLLKIDLIDKSKQAYKICQRNVVKNNVNCSIILNDFNNIELDKYSFILANLPYLPLKTKVNQEAKFEPKNALYSGKDGLRDYANLFKKINSNKSKTLLILIEKLSILDQKLIKLSQKNNYKIIYNDQYVMGLLTKKF